MVYDPGPHHELTGIIVDCAIEVHRTLGGPGLLEKIYEEALAIELEKRGLKVMRQVPVPVFYKGQRLQYPLRLDLTVEEQVIVECKTAVQFHDVFKAQLLTYLKVSGYRVGLVLNFGHPLMKDGIYRIAN